MIAVHVCPKCQSREIDRLPLDMVERLILFLRRKRLYRCRECDHRFRDRPLSRRPVGR
jgi:hypothetical protein